MRRLCACAPHATALTALFPPPPAPAACSDRLSVWNKAVLYVKENEVTASLLIVHVHGEEEAVPESYQENARILDTMYPKIRITFLDVPGQFTPAFIQHLSERLHVPTNMMFITCPDGHFPHRIAELGGVRVITR